MAHRGRLNVLTNVMAKPFRAVFNEFKGGSANPAEVEGSGDVKYHLGASSDRAFDGNNVHLSLTANPSHLEIVDPVVLGKVRAKQDQRAKPNVERTSVVPLLIHGDAAFAGQGVVAECLGLSGLKGHRTGGSIHFIINNQIGFTTDPRFSRSSPYPSDVAKMVEAPIFHCNGDDPEAVTFAAKIAIEYRQKFGKPVVIDMLCYRRFGHNEGDEPAFTQPKMYQRIRKHPTGAGDLRQEARRRGRAEPGAARRPQGRVPRHARRRARGRQQLQGQQGRLARRPLGRLQGRARGRGRSAPRQDRRAGRDPARDRPAHHHAAPRLPPAPHDPALLRQPRQGGGIGPGHRLGDRRGPGLRLAPASRATASASRARTSSAAPSRSATPW